KLIVQCKRRPLRHLVPLTDCAGWTRRHARIAVFTDGEVNHVVARVMRDRVDRTSGFARVAANAGLRIDQVLQRIFRARCCDDHESLSKRCRQRVRAALYDSSVETHVLKIDRLAIDPGRRWRNPAGELPGLYDAPHQRCDKGAILSRWKPFGFIRVPLRLRDYATIGRNTHFRQRADLAMKRLMPHLEAEL